MDEMDELSFVHFSYICNVNQCNSETMSKKRNKKFGSLRIFSYICPRIVT